MRTDYSSRYGGHSARSAISRYGKLTYLRTAIDTGGTFTDCVYFEAGELRVLKVFSTPVDPSAAVLDALGQIGGADEALHATEVRHGTTVGTNAMLEGKTARVAFITTAGFEDTIAIGRQTRSLPKRIRHAGRVSHDD